MLIYDRRKNLINFYLIGKSVSDTIFLSLSYNSLFDNFENPLISFILASFFNFSIP